MAKCGTGALAHAEPELSSALKRPRDAQTVAEVEPNATGITRRHLDDDRLAFVQDIRMALNRLEPLIAERCLAFAGCPPILKEQTTSRSSLLKLAVI